jgi:CRP-like cAMP-binding protein
MSNSISNSISNRDRFCRNQLLKALPTDIYQRLEADLETVDLSLHQVIYEVNEPIPYLYFPCSAVVSLIYPMQSGSVLEVGLVGLEGMVGLPALLSSTTQTHQANVQLEGEAVRVKAEVVKAEFNRGGALQDLMLRYFQAFIGQISLTAVSNRFYTIEERLARWLLLVSDSIQADSFMLTHEFISQMLGVRRAGVTVAAGALSQSELITYTRGRITILNREALIEFSGECYSVGRSELVQLLGDRSG